MTDIEFSNAIASLAQDADDHDTTCEDAEDGCCISNRWRIMACLMNSLGLSLADLGHIAESWMDLQCEIEDHVNHLGTDSILDAKEIDG